jgi:hypothetical protein
MLWPVKGGGFDYYEIMFSFRNLKYMKKIVTFIDKVRP